ncbi:MAG: hypothetical protein L0Y64_26895, partial [Myxococcaceae bacterium]|nr:hypothetical protein [Myxococcaceae bacterium]
MRTSWLALMVVLAACGSPHSVTSADFLAVRGGILTLKGKGLGATQGASVVRVGEALASEYLSWTDTEVRVRVPRATLLGTVDVAVVVAGREAHATTRVVLARPLSARHAHSLALKADGTVVAWGLNFQGQATVPPGLSDVVAIAAGHGHSLALKADGTVVSWGNNSDGPFGPATVPSGLSDVVAIAAGSGHNLALKADGTVVAWGRNDFGQATVPPGLSDVVA